MKQFAELYENLVRQGLEVYKDYLDHHISSANASDYPEDADNARLERDKLKNIISTYENDNKFSAPFSQYFIDNALKTKTGSSELNIENVEIIVAKNMDGAYSFYDNYIQMNSINLERNKYLSELEVLRVKATDVPPPGCIKVEDDGICFFVKADEKDLLKYNITRADLISEINMVTEKGLSSMDPPKHSSDIHEDFMDSFYEVESTFNGGKNLNSMDPISKNELNENGNRQPFNMSENKKQIIPMEKEKENKHEFSNISGRIGADAKLISGKENAQGAVFTVAEKVAGQEEARWHNVQVWEDKIKGSSDVKATLENFKKGDAVVLHGYNKTSEFTYKDGHEKAGQKGVNNEFVVTEVKSHVKKDEITKAKDHANSETNQVTIKGRLGADPEIKTVKDNKIAYFSVAAEDGKGGTQWHNCKAVDQYIEKAGIDKLKKGDLVEIKGFLGKEYDYTHSKGEKQGQVEQKRDVYIGETEVIKKAESKSQEQSTGQGHSM